MLLRLAAALAVLLSLVAVPAAEAALPDCDAGRTLLARDGARIFYSPAREAVFGCRRGDRRGRFLVYDDPTYGFFEVLRGRGTVVPFLEATTSEGGSYEHRLGWFDLRTGRRALTTPFLNGTFLEVLEVVVARDGTTAVVSREEGRDAVVSIHPVRRGRVRDGRGLAFVAGRYTRGSLRIGGERLRWRDAAGARSVPRTGEPVTCAAGRTKLAAGPVRIFEVLVRNRGALRWCGPAAASPQRVPGPGRRFFPLLARLAASAEAGGRVAFAGDGVAGVIDLGAGAVRALGGIGPYAGVTPGPGGELVAAFDTPDGATEGGVVVARPRGDRPFALARPQLVATSRDELVPGSLSASGETITWRTEQGERSVPLGGETAVTCTAGTTLGREKGTRLFEVLLVARGERTLAACRDGVAEPVPLLTQPLDVPFPHWFVGVQDGRGVLIRWGQGDDAADRVVTFGETPDSVRSGVVRGWGWLPLRDVRVGPDGAVAVVVDRLGGEYDVLFLAPTPTGLTDARRLVRRKDGFKRGSLTVTETEVRWRNAKGASRSAPRP